MTYVVNLEDGGGQDFFLNTEGTFTPLSSIGSTEPQTFPSYRSVARKIDQLRPGCAPTCRLYAVEQREFNKRRLALQSSPSGH